MAEESENAAEAAEGRGAFPLPILLIAFACSRVIVFAVAPPYSDVPIYAGYVFDFEVGCRTGESLYDAHEQHVAAQIQQVLRHGKTELAERLEPHKIIEYPPLAIGVILLPHLVTRTFRPLDASPDSRQAYVMGYRLLMLLVEVGVFFLVLSLVRRGILRAGGSGAGQLVVYIAAGFLLWPVLYDRLDLVQAALILLAAALLLSRLHYAVSFFALALAINFKLVPLVLAPVWVVGALPAGWLAQGATRSALGRLLLLLLVRSLVLAGLTAGVFAGGYLVAGPRSLDFLRFHQDRGIQIESLYSAALLVLQPLGHDVEVQASHGGIDVVSPATPALATAATALLAVLLLAATALLATAYYRTRAVAETFARAHARDWLAFVTLFLLLAITAGKVFSPQYLVWLVPLVPLTVLGSAAATRRFQWAFVATCALTTLIFPFLYFRHIPVQTEREYVYDDPTLLGVAVLAIRNLLVVMLAAALAVSLVRRWRRTTHRFAAGGTGNG